MAQEREPSEQAKRTAWKDNRSAAMVEKQRRYIRDYMRKWRASNPEKQEQLNFERKARVEIEPVSSGTAEVDVSICGFCRKRPSVSEVLRLRVSDANELGYEEIRVPYCGIC